MTTFVPDCLRPSRLAQLAALSLLVGCSEPPPSKPGAASAAVQEGANASAARPALTVSLARPSSELLEMTMLANGNIEAWQEASVGAELPGLRLASVRVNVGDVVSKSQVLATFAEQTLEAESEQGRAAVMQAKAAHESAKADAKRARTIREEGALAESQIDQYLLQEKVTLAQLSAAATSYAVAQMRLEKTQVLAPDDGVISARTATVGAVAGAGQELFRLVRQGRLEWRAEVTPAEVGRIKVGSAATVTAASGLEVDGKVRAIAPTADAQSRNVLVFVDLPRNGELRAGTYARGRFLLGQSQALTVPAASVVMRDGHSYVFVIGADNKANQRKVEVGRRVGERVELLNGLKAEDSVVVQGAGFLNEGDLVKVVK